MNGRRRKLTPHYDLASIQSAAAELGAAAFTKTALDGGREMGLTSVEMLTVVASLARRNFYKSMTTHFDHRVWQDVYHEPNACWKRGVHQGRHARRGAGDSILRTDR